MKFARTAMAFGALLGLVMVPLAGWSATYRVWNEGGGNIYPYDTWEKAATKIQTALDVALAEGDIILISNGVYTASSGVEVMGVSNANTLTIQGRGNGETVIDGELARRGITMTAAATNVVIEGLTITRGLAPIVASINRYGPAIYMDAARFAIV